MDDIEQKIDKLTLMINKLVTEDKDKVSHLSHEYISQIKVEVRTDIIIKAGLDLIMCIEVIQDIIKILEVE